ncbi:aldo/keto reductase [Natronorarus salvus]|uniref:aldo/keto reductase n=1 Tax=Natronorarus salvus TaxID=3117733 RepID=UPI002F265CFB
MSDMEYTDLGETGLEVSRLCLGCMNFGSDAEWMMDDEEASVDLIREAIDEGVNFLDTADVYSRGESEEIVGRAIEGYDRSELVIATKVFGRMHEGPNGQGLSRKRIVQGCRESLDRLGLDYVDLYQIHRFDHGTPIEETLDALDTLVDEGLVRYVGASTMAAWRFSKMLYEADLGGYRPFVSMQPEYNLVDRHEEENVLPLCAEEGIGVIPWSPLAGGFLTGKYDREEEPAGDVRATGDEHTRARFTDENWAVLEEVERLAEEKGTTPVAISLAWLLSKEVVDAPIIGPRSSKQLEGNLEALSVSLDDREVERLEAPKEPVWSRAIGDV